ncbi:Fic family protein [Schaalia vaccimaxillae]|uniref:Fic family protein n=1 Tax=Schaalia vaccimaxillae TaxID=183916 RepID=UPI0003B4412D|nr:Fic family protein [Schaalia vaccimaxillae]
MKIPVPPPAPYRQMLSALSLQDAAKVMLTAGLDTDTKYHPWEWFFRHDPPEGFSREEWWIAVRFRRAQTARPLPFQLKDGTSVTFNIPDPLLELMDDISARARGQAELPEQIANPTTRNRYLIRSLIEESMTSSQLEGAATSRIDAKKLLREQRTPKDRSEQMIVNNYLAMQEIVDLKDQSLTPDLILRIHQIVTKQTLDNPEDSGRIQQPGEERVRIYGTQTDEQVLHVPPAAEELKERMEKLCAFANGQLDGDMYVPPLLRAITLHFMMGYDHYFVDGNGRTARAIFYWSMLNQGFFLVEFLSISRLLLKAPAQYARSYLYTEQDEGDLTYFFLEQAKVVKNAIDDLDEYLHKKTGEIKAVARALRSTGFNHRQIDLLESFARDPGANVTVGEHQRTHGVSNQTARTDLQALEAHGLIIGRKRGKTAFWFPDDELVTKIQKIDRSS